MMLNESKREVELNRDMEESKKGECRKKGDKEERDR